MQRRNFIKNSILATGALTIPLAGSKIFAGCTAAAPKPATGVFKKAMMWESIGVQGSILDKCMAIKEAGFVGVEPSSHLDRKEMIDALKTTGLTATDVCCSTHWKKRLTDPDAAVRQEAIEGVTVALEDAHAYGTDAILLVPGVVNDNVTYEDCWKLSTEGINKLLPVAKKLNVQICIENVPNYFLFSPLEAKSYVDQFKTPFVKFFFDIGNVMHYGWPEQWINILGDRIGRVHIKEFSRKIADQKGRRAGLQVALLEGDVNWTKVMEALRKNYRNEWLIAEQPKSNTLEELQVLIDQFDKILSM